ncbi:MAG: bifunctional 5,10-methylene-tetrahydrofolate dehydrogenase/5,10-methylene-tetrahydrofolate cyclohydrolase [Ruminococcaceae bacterium]|nr:bifunctional 5,10-methylene-tetrahydrofolate dehydrogenase/5,10-methylene-tetrahydrofolate cyclohydrolase [Oscillospiraceae bacterium]
MPAKRIDGTALAAGIKAAAARDAQKLAEQGVRPRLAVFLVGDDPASAIYVRGKEKDCAESGIESVVERLPADTSEETLLERIYAENSNPHTHGILVQLPLPKQIDESRVIEAIDPAKDVDVFTPENVGLLQIGRPFLLPCTPAGCLHMIQSTGIDLAGKEAVVVGRSNIVGKPMAALLLAQNCTVTMCHSKTRDLAAKCASADILVAAIGRAKMITGDMIKPGAVVIDVGMNRDENDKLCGDVDYATASEVAGFITPVPGGVGPMTRAMLMANTIKAAGRLSAAFGL